MVTNTSFFSVPHCTVCGWLQRVSLGSAWRLRFDCLIRLRLDKKGLLEIGKFFEIFRFNVA